MSEPIGTVANRMLYSQVEKMACATCWQPVQLYCEDGKWVVHCRTRCLPGGLVSKEYVEARRQSDRMEYESVASAYPQLDPRPRPSDGERDSLKNSLYGGDHGKG